jgi:hypothetical protein
MANWVVFNNTLAKPVSLAINLDMVKSITPGSVANTVSLDGTLVVGSIAGVMLLTSHTIYPGVQGGPITAG